MIPVSQIELNAHFKDLERQVVADRRSQNAASGWLGRVWRGLRPKGADSAKAPAPKQPGPVTAHGLS